MTFFYKINDSGCYEALKNRSVYDKIKYQSLTDFHFQNILLGSITRTSSENDKQERMLNQIKSLYDNTKPTDYPMVMMCPESLVEYPSQESFLEIMNKISSKVEVQKEFLKQIKLLHEQTKPEDFPIVMMRVDDPEAQKIVESYGFVSLD